MRPTGSHKLQASSLTTCPGYDRMDLERNIMTELEKLKKMLVDAHNELRARKQKNTPTFGAMMFMLEAIVQCNKALGESKKSEKN